MPDVPLRVATPPTMATLLTAPLTVVPLVA
jgi:hypothetical protein